MTPAPPGRHLQFRHVVIPVLTTLLVLLQGSPLSVPADATAAAPAGIGDSAHRSHSDRDERRDRLAERVRLGAHVKGMSHEPGRLARFEQMARREVDVASIYWGYGDVFPGTTELSLADQGRRDVLLSWDMGATRFTDWSSGSQDAYLDRIASAALAYPYTVYVRPWPEMNGDWQAFQPTPGGERPYGGTPEEFVDAWRHVVDHFRARGVSNIRWVFNPAADIYAETTPVASIWPGPAYVDVLGIDGFNWGRGGRFGAWRSFDQIFGPMYRELTRLHRDAPVWICEVGSKEPRRADGAPRDPDRSKAAWIRQAMMTRRYPRMTTLVWFQERKERDWRINSSRPALRAFLKVAPQR